MLFGIIEWYLVVINIIGFILYGVNVYLYRSSSDKQIDIVITIVSLIGGSLGILLFMLFFDRRAVKANMMSRVFITCVFVVQVVIYLLVIGKHSSEITLAFWAFFEQHKLLLYYAITVNVVTFIAFGVDKNQAIKGGNRIRIVTLLGLSIVGGSIGALVGMYAFRHKIKKDYFMVGVPMIIAMQIVLLFYLMNV